MANDETSETLDRIEALTRSNAAYIEAMSNQNSQDNEKLNSVTEQMARLATSQANYRKTRKQ